MTRSTLLAGTMLPALVLAGPLPAKARDATVGAHIQFAQLDEPGGRGGPGGGRGGPGGGERGGPPDRGGGAPERGARERPEPREAPAARERPARPEPQERATPPAARERPERQERPEPRQAPATRERPDRTETPQRPERQERPQRQEAPAAPAAPTARERPDPTPKPERAAPAQREDREPTRRGRDTDRDTDRTPDRSPTQQRQDRTPERGQDRDGDGRPDRGNKPTANEPARTAPAQPGTPGATQPGATAPAAPNQRPGVPGRPVQAPDANPAATPPAARPNAAQPAAPNAAQPPSNQPAAPNQRPGVPGRPVQAPPGQTPPGQAPNATPPAAQPNAGQPPVGQPVAPGATPPATTAPGAPPVAPNQRSGVPGRPVQDPNAAQPGAQPNAVPPGQAPQPVAPGQPAAPNAAQPQAGQPVVPSDRPGVPGRPAADPNVPPLQPGQQQRLDQSQRDGSGFERRDRFNVPGNPGYVQGGFRNDDYEYRDYDRVRRDRREYDIDGRSYYREPGRIIVRDRDGYFIRHDETERFRYLDQRGYRSERRGRDTYSYLDRPGGEQIVTVVDDDGRLLRRYRRFRDGRELVIINNDYGPGGPRPIYEDVVDLPPPDIRIPRDRYVVDYGRADAREVYGALTAPPVMAIDRRYTLDQVRYSPQLRARMPSIDINTINFASGSFTIDAEQARQLQVIADGINQAIKANPQEVFLIEGYTDAVGAEVDNLSLSDRRAQSVATVLTQTFNVPPENLTTQGYGEQYLKVNTQEANRENRRVTVRRITPLIQQQADVPQSEVAPPR